MFVAQLVTSSVTVFEAVIREKAMIENQKKEKI